MDAKQIIDEIRSGAIKAEDGSALVAVIMTPDGKAEIAADNATPFVFRLIGLGLIESAVKAEIKAAL